MKAYNQPFYYEIAFSFIDIKKQVDLFERFIRRYSKINVRRVLDLGCGPGLQLRELAERGYAGIGLDLSSRMLGYLNEKAKGRGLDIETVRADMTGFRLKKKADFALSLMGTIGCIESKEMFLSHLGSVADSLRPGGLYLIDGFRLDWAGNQLLGPGSWTMRRGAVTVRSTYDVRVKDALRQMLKHTLRLDVDDGGRRLVYEERGDSRMIFPQELLTLLEAQRGFEFLGWFERHRMRPLKKAATENLTLLRRR